MILWVVMLSSLDEDSSGIMHIRRDGKTITKLSKQDRLDEKKQLKDELAAADAKHEAEMAALRAELAEAKEQRKVEATV